MKTLETTNQQDIDTTPPSKLRLKLTTSQDVRKELARLYREGKSGQREIADVSRLANVLQILNRCIETSDIEERLEALEKNVQAKQYEQH